MIELLEEPETLYVPLTDFVNHVAFAWLPGSTARKAKGRSKRAEVSGAPSS
jgi:hypothetical protein